MQAGSMFLYRQEYDVIGQVCRTDLKTDVINFLIHKVTH
jgi:hypothetical protein